MSKLCERPGCSDLGSIAYGMIPEDLLFWLAPLGPSDLADDADPRVLCRRHADAMMVPRGWTLDDRRDAHLHLFNTNRFMPSDEFAEQKTAHHPDELPASVVADRKPVAERANPSRTGDPAQLQIDGTGEFVRPRPAGRSSDEIEPAAHVSGTAADLPPATPWAPRFDDTDDLDGLLEVNSPLLSRAFNGRRRKRGG